MSNLNVSLESHLVDVLKPLPAILPLEISDQLKPYLSQPPAATIPYQLLSSVSQWSRTPTGRTALISQIPKLDPQSYNIIALLAGTTTSPERKFPVYVSKEDEEAVSRKRAANDRKAITALINALFSIGGCGFATWWAAERLGWRNEWRVLLSISAAAVVAISEAVLYIIWSSRKSAKRPLKDTIPKKYDGPADQPPDIDNIKPREGLRQRAVPTFTESE